jgi:hypothetical protein
MLCRQASHPEQRLVLPCWQQQQQQQEAPASRQPVLRPLLLVQVVPTPHHSLALLLQRLLAVAP